MKKVSTDYSKKIRRAAWFLGVLLLASLAACSRSSTGNGIQNTIVMVSPAEIFPSYTGEVQGIVLSANPSAHILQAVLPANRSMLERAFELDQLVRTYPSGTIFLIFGNSVPGREGLPIVMKTKAGRILVGPDSGVFTRVLEREEAESLCHVGASQWLQGEGMNSMFPERDVYAPIAAQLAGGAALDPFGKAGTSPVRVPIPKASVTGSALNGEVLFVNWSGRVVTNFRVETFEKVHAGDLIRLNTNGKAFTVPYLLNESEAPPGRPFGVCNVDGFFEIAVLDANAAQVLKLVPGQKITIR